MIEVKCSKLEGIRQLIDLALSAGRSRQSAQTGFVHYFYDTLDEPTQDCIPLFENFNFVLALLRSYNAEAHPEAIQLLDRLLYFQNNHDDASRGNFPRYFHEFPHCHDRFLAIRLLPTFYWTLKQFNSVLGEQLLQRLKTAAEEALNYGLRLQLKGDLPYSIAIKLAASMIALGAHFELPDWKNKGEEQLNYLQKQCDSSNHSHWSSPTQIADTVVALQMVYPSIKNSPWSNFWQYLSQVWHHNSCSYIGPAFEEYQDGEEPKNTLYDLLMGYLAQSYSYRCFLVHPFQIEAAVVQAINDDLITLTYPFETNIRVSDSNWLIKQNKEYAYTAVQISSQHPIKKIKNFYPFRLVWGKGTRTHSFVLQEEQPQNITFKNAPDGLDITITLSKIPQSNKEDKKSKVLSFYCDIDPNTKITIGDTQATTFTLKDMVKVISEFLKFDIAFHIEEGSGQFTGHILPENRPAQIPLRGENRFEVFDSSIFLNALSTPSDNCTIKVTLRF